MNDNEYLEKLFNDSKIALDALNEISPSFYSKDEYKLRHKVFKRINSEYNKYKFKLFIQKIKLKILKWKLTIQQKRKEKILKDYNKLKENGEFLPKVVEK